MHSDHYDNILYQCVVSARSGTKRTFPLRKPFSLSLSPSFLFPVIYKEKELKCPLFSVLTFPDLSEHCRNTMFYYNRLNYCDPFKYHNPPLLPQITLKTLLHKCKHTYSHQRWQW